MQNKVISTRWEEHKKGKTVYLDLKLLSQPEQLQIDFMFYDTFIFAL